MNEAFVVDREFLFKSCIHDITSISIEHNYDINGSCVLGEFIVSGDYRLHEISINKEDFSFKIPFKEVIPDNINLDTIELEITDFNYDLVNEDELKVHVEYVISGEQEIIEFDSEKDLNEFLETTKADVVDLTLRKEDTNDFKEENKEDNISRETKEQDREEETQEIKGKIIEVKSEESSKSIDQNMMMNAINSEEEYIKYHIHVVTANDSIESILLKYNISLIDLKKYNTFENLELNMKLIIPENEEN